MTAFSVVVAGLLKGMASEAIKFMNLRERILREKRYIRRLEHVGKDSRHRKKVLKRLESELGE